MCAGNLGDSLDLTIFEDVLLSLLQRLTTIASTTMPRTSSMTAAARMVTPSGETKMGRLVDSLPLATLDNGCGQPGEVGTPAVRRIYLPHYATRSSLSSQMGTGVRLLHLKLGRDVYAAADASEHGTAVGVNCVRPKGRVVFVGREPEVIGDVDTSHHQHSSV